ncbi:hypothetical protein QD712_25615 [Streptomyces acidiscabies]|uniref:hypothetical protein n=1 Tax=Streptomyces acidiscabies TaxID=42234 RepID=UPI0030D5EF1B
MGLYHTVTVAYGFEIPATTDFERLDEVLADQPNSERPGRVHHTYLGDFERLFLLAESTEVDENAFTAVMPNAYTRYEVPAWNAALHLIAGRLGYEQHPLPAWLVLHDHS